MTVLIFFADEFTRTLQDKRPSGQAERVRVVTLVCRTMTKKGHHFLGKKGDAISYRTG